MLLPSTETLETLHRWGIRTYGEFAALPVPQLSERSGQEGVRLHELACGTYSRALMLADPETSFEEELALDYAVTELEPLSFLLGRLLDQLCARLAARSLAASAFCLRLELQDSVEEDPQLIRKHSASNIDLELSRKLCVFPYPCGIPKHF